MKHFENSQRWIQRETNYWMTWVSFLNSYPLWPKGIMCMEMGQFLLSGPCPFAVGVTWARDLCRLHDYLCDSWRGAASVPSLPSGCLEETAAAKYIIVLLRDWKCPTAIRSHYLSPLVVSSPFYNIILFLPGELFSPAYKLTPVSWKPLCVHSVSILQAPSKSLPARHLYFFVCVCVYCLILSG